MTNAMIAESANTVAGVAAAGAKVTAGKAKSKKSTKRQKGASKGRKLGKTAKTAKGKGARIVEMVGKAKGATLTEIMTATGWQAHSVRGFLSTAGKKYNLKIESSKNEAGSRFYRIVA